MMDRIGQQLGNYRLIRLLGQGGFASVYLGEHIHLETQAAIKVLHAQLTAEAGRQFRDEARTIAHLIHPLIVRVLDFGVEGTTPFLVMDYAPNGTLRQRHPKGTRVALSTVVPYVLQIAEALQYAHDQKLTHRDVKPENMLIGRRNEVILSDFGIAAISHSTSSMTAQASAGTAPYMAPEQIQAQARAASDQYALGIVVYEWLSGERPFDGSFTEIFAKHLMTSPPPLCEKVANLSPMVERVVLTALAKDPKQRFPSVQAFATALLQASQVEPNRVLSAEQTPHIKDARAEFRPDLPSSQPTLGTSDTFIPTEPMTPSISSSFSSILSTPANPPAKAPKTPIAGQPVPAKRGLSRRMVVVGLAGLTGVAVVGGGLLWLIPSQQS